MKKNEIAADYLSRHKEVEKVYITDDGNIFLDTNPANFHTTICGGKAETFDRSILKKAEAPKAPKAPEAPKAPVASKKVKKVTKPQTLK